MKFKCALFSLALLAFGILTARADIPPVSVSFSVMSLEKNIDDLYYFNAGKPCKFSVYQTDIVGPLRYSGDPMLAFFKKGPPDPETGQPTWLPVARVKVGYNIRECLLLFFSSKNEGHYRVALQPSARDLFKEGEMMIFNLSPVPVGGKFGDKVIKLAPNASEKLRFPNLKEGEYVMLKLACSTDSGWQMLYSKPFTPFQHARRWLFVVPSPYKTMGLQIRALKEPLEPPPSEEPDAPAGGE